MITSSGAKCDVCGLYILPLSEDEMVNTFSVSAIPDRELHCDNACKEKLIACGKDWTKLPEGPLRTAFLEATDAMTQKRWQCPECLHTMTEDESKGYVRCPTGVHFVQHVKL